MSAPYYLAAMQLPESLLLASSAAVIHFMSLTSIVASARVLPFRWLESFWREAGYVAEPGAGRWTVVAGGIAFLALATWLTVLLLSGGSYGTPLGIIEALLAVAWLGLLLFGARTPRN